MATTPLATSSAMAETIRLHVGDRLARVSLLKPGSHRYLRYMVRPDGSRAAVDFWVREISFGADHAMRIRQRWDRAGGPDHLDQDSLFEAGSFAPATHERRMVHDGATTTSGYRFGRDRVTGMAELAGSDNKDFEMPMPEASFNFEYDMELLQALPLAAGRTFAIPFYDAGIDKAPAVYDFRVAASERIAGWSGGGVDCWLVTADYRTGKVRSRFWFDKATQTLVREEQAQLDGSVLIKSLLPPESADAAEGRRNAGATVGNAAGVS